MRMTEKPSLFGDTQNPNIIQQLTLRRIRILINLWNSLKKQHLLL